jgi:hypothetical protein
MPRKMLRLGQLGRLLTGMGVVDRDGSSNSRAAAGGLGHGAAVGDVFENRVEGFLGLWARGC